MPMFAYAILKTAVVARWIGWLGMVVAVFAGWLGLLLGRMSAVIEGISSVGFLAFFIFMPQHRYRAAASSRTAHGQGRACRSDRARARRWALMSQAHPDSLPGC
ncbi:MAG TPA: hypothetical protein VK875_07640 [Euzebyales bacterium]|nr:hypothetical protein [Euzebyales bacterium]